MTVMSCEFESHFLHEERIFAEIAQLVEHNLAKVRVASSSLVFRSKREGQCRNTLAFFRQHTEFVDEILVLAKQFLSLFL